MKSERTLRARGARNLIAQETVAHPARFTRVAALRVRDAPMLLLAVSFAAGILYRAHWQPPQHMVAAVVLLMAVSAVAAWRAPRVAWFATVVCWAALGWTAASLESTGVDTSLLRYADGLQRHLEGRVTAVRKLLPQAPPTEALRNGEPPPDEETAYVAREPLDTARYAVTVEASSIEDVTPDLSRMVPMRGSTRLTLYSSPHQPVVLPPCGAIVELTARLHPPQRYMDPGVRQYADALAREGIGSSGTANAGSLRALQGGTPSLPCRFAAAQQWSVERLHALVANPVLRHAPRLLRVTDTDAAMLSAMLVGDRTALTHGLRTAFERTGSFHLFVVAGVHVTLLLAGLYTLLLKLRVPRWPSAALALALTTLYALLTGFGAPVQRALLMSAVYLLTALLGRGRHPLNALGTAALAMLVLHPHALLESGFQMTVLAVIAIAGLAVPITERTLVPYLHALRDIRRLRLDPRLPPRLAQLRVALRWVGEELAGRPAGVRATSSATTSRSAQWLQQSLIAAPALLARALLTVLEVCAITLIAELVLALPMALYFHRTTPFAAPANLLALPLIGLLMGSAIVTFAASLLHPWFAALPAAVTALLLHGVTFAVGAISTLRGADVRVPGPLLASIALVLLLWAASMVLVRAATPRRGWLGAALLPAALALILWPRRADLSPNSLEFTAIDVGQGDSLLVASPGGQAMLIDAGGPTGSALLADAPTFDVGEEVVSPYLWSRGLRLLDVLVLTHAHSDHIGGMAAVLRNFRPRELWISVDADTPLFRTLLQLAQQQGTVVRHLRGGERHTWDGTSIDVLNPLPDYQTRREPVNDDSLVLRIGYGRASVLAQGDAERPSEQVELGEQPTPVTLLKVGHHGSNTSTTEALLAAVQPQCAIISCGRGNHFGHPRWQVLERLQAAGAHTARTDQMGAVQYLLHADGSIQVHVLASNP